MPLVAVKLFSALNPPRSGLRAAARLLACALAPLTALTGCTPGDHEAVSEHYKQLEVSLIEGPMTDPVQSAGVCVLQAPRLSPAELLLYWLEPAVSTMVHLGRSIESCIAGQAKASPFSQWNSYFDARIDISYQGDCPGNAYSCFWSPDLIMLDPVHIATREQPEWFQQALIGHELYHAIAGNYHP